MLQSQVRYKLVDAVETLLNQPGDKETACQILDAIWREFLSAPFSLDSIVFGSLVQEALDCVSYEDTETLHMLLEELRGKIPSKHSYALRYNFVALLSGDVYEAYRGLTKLFQIMSQRIVGFIASQAEIEEYENFRESLHILCYEKIQVHTLMDLLVTQGCHALLLLPDNGERYFDILEDASFLSIYPPSNSKEAIEPHLAYVEGLLQKLEGLVTVFVDVHLLPEGFVINLR